MRRHTIKVATSLLSWNTRSISCIWQIFFVRHKKKAFSPINPNTHSCASLFPSNTASCQADSEDIATPASCEDIKRPTTFSTSARIIFAFRVRDRASKGVALYSCACVESNCGRQDHVYTNVGEAACKRTADKTIIIPPHG